LPFGAIWLGKVNYKAVGILLLCCVEAVVNSFQKERKMSEFPG
jgi:hypothetical protein